MSGADRLSQSKTARLETPVTAFTLLDLRHLACSSGTPRAVIWPQLAETKGKARRHMHELTGLNRASELKADV